MDQARGAECHLSPGSDASAAQLTVELWEEKHATTYMFVFI